MRRKATPDSARWIERSRKENRYWSGMGAARGWCIYARAGGFCLAETSDGGMVQTPTGVRSAKRFGPFDSFDAARVAFNLVGDTK